MLELLFSALPELIAATPVLLIGLLPSALLVMLALSMGNTTQIRRAVRAMGEGCDPAPEPPLFRPHQRRHRPL